MANQAWKCAERRVAKLLGTSRTGPTGKDDNDIVHDKFAVEIKYRSRLPQWALECLLQARTAKKATGKMPFSILLERGKDVNDGLVVIRLEDFLNLAKEPIQVSAGVSKDE